jgi:hypothetical protein
MADIMSILSSSYTSATLSTPSNTPYTNVDPASYQGTWDGTYSNNQKFQISVSQVNGFRAQVKYQSGTTVQYQSVLIKDSSFRIGDTKFTLTKAQTPATAATDTDPATDAQGGSASIRTAITDPTTGSTSLVTGTATQEI